MALSRLLKSTASLRAVTCIQSSRFAFSSIAADAEYVKFPREAEGNIYSDNWSLVVDGVTPTGNAYRNARLELLTTHAGIKGGKGVIEVTRPVFDGKFVIQESGAELNHEQFTELVESQGENLSVESNLFVEDAGLGALNSIRVGVRVTTPNAAVALLARHLLIPVPPRPSNHMARYNGWNQDPRWQRTNSVWDGNKYVFPDNATFKARADRHVVALVGKSHNSNTLAVQFAESEGAVVGATVLAGDDVPIRGLIEAVGHAAAVVINQEQSAGIVVPSVSVFNGSSTAVIIGADDSVVASAASKKVLYGAYHNYISAAGVSALWNGIIGATEHATAPGVSAGGKSVTVTAPQNLAHPAKHFIFYAKDGPSGKLTEEEAVKRLVELTDESKAAVIAEIVKGASISTAGSADACQAAVAGK